ncbi:NEK1 [Acrasis kona]|uniref:non-specific serine/threonine protein kinase n=1 Tax=Acrasis kona TaxID=1008807 RepID=A0AAW2YL83_9EUKA
MDSYVIEKKIGSGSYGNCFLAHLKENPDKRYVIKKVPLSNMSTKERKAAQQEVTLLQSLQHPNIVSYRDSFMDNGEKDLCIVMSHCAGGDLGGKLKNHKGPIPEDQLIKWFVQIALALDYIHSKKILHRDLKAGNIFLTKSGQIKLGDFGIARVLNRTMDMAQTSIGTPLYMSPECCNNKPYSYKSDVWSLGCVMYELVTGQLPFNAQDLRGLFMKIVRGIYTPIRTTGDRAYSANIKNLVDRMLVTTAAKRPSVRSTLLTPFLSKHVLEYRDQIKTQVATTMDIEAIEQNNLQMQIADMGVVEASDTPRSNVLSRPSSAASLNSPPSEKTPPRVSPYAQQVKKTPPKLVSPYGGLVLRNKIVRTPPLVAKKSPSSAGSPSSGSDSASSNSGTPRNLGTPKVENSKSPVANSPAVASPSAIRRPSSEQRNINNRINLIQKDKERVKEAMEKLKREKEERLRLHEERLKRIEKEREEKMNALRGIKPSPRNPMIKLRFIMFRCCFGGQSASSDDDSMIENNYTVEWCQQIRITNEKVKHQVVLSYPGHHRLKIKNNGKHAISFHVKGQDSESRLVFEHSDDVEANFMYDFFVKKQNTVSQQL